MQRRHFIKNVGIAGMAMHPLVRSWNAWSPGEWKLSGPRQPVFIYNNWSSYDELSDKIPLTEELAMRELEEVLRLKKQGVQIDYYLMDAFWFDPAGGYRVWHKEHWPNGPGKWLDACKKNNIKPGMWFSTNLIAGGGNHFLDLIDAWKNSSGKDGGILCLFEGGYLQHLSDTLQMWYNEGVRLFKFDFAYFEAATESAKKKYTPDEIKEKNITAFMQMLQQFRAKNNDVLITGYNGFGGVLENTYTEFTKTIDLRWLNVFDTLYSGDPRFSDVPMMNIWRSEDNYSDHQVRQFEFNGLPLRRIDSCAFMIGKTGTCYSRALQCWKGMLILELARGGWVNVYHGNLELLSDKDAVWFGKVQGMYHQLQQYGQFSTFGAIPGKAQPYGFLATGAKGSVYTVVNPSQKIMTVQLPGRHPANAGILYVDGGYRPSLKDHAIIIGPEQLAVVGTGMYADKKYDMGTDDTITIPSAITALKTSFTATGNNSIEGHVQPLPGKAIRILVQQFDQSGFPVRSWGGAPPDGKKMDTFIKITVQQDGKEVQARKEYDKMIWSGLSWGAIEIPASSLQPGKPLIIQCASTEKGTLMLKAAVYAAEYNTRS